MGSWMPPQVPSAAGVGQQGQAAVEGGGGRACKTMATMAPRY